jgi:threonine/homoserine/homoserine lactone efflux protein
MSNAAKVGFKRAVPFNWGIFFGCSIVMILCLLFSTFLYAIIPQVQLPMKILGAAYMVYLIIKMLLPSKKTEIADSEISSPEKSPGGSFLAGAGLQLLNPKIMIYGITAMSSFILPFYKSMPILIGFAFLLSFTSLISTLCWAAFGSIFSLLFNKHGKIVNIIMALLLLYCVASLFLY